jgi:hypothetical protein
LAGVTLEDGTHLYFGQELAEVEVLTGAKAAAGGVRPKSGGPARVRMALRDVSLDFENGYLRSVEFRRFRQPPEPFPELWKNFAPVGTSAVTPGLPEPAFREYLAHWEERLGKQGLQRGRDYRIEENSSATALSFLISMAPQRRSQAGRWIWDSWMVSFNPAGRGAQRELRLTSLIAQRGDLSTAPPSPATQRRTEAKALSGEAPKIEPPPLEFALPKIP